MLTVLIKDLQDGLVEKQKEIDALKLRVQALEEKLELNAIEHYNELQKLDDCK